jgi:phage/plasmid-associated DNA primase
MSDKPRRYAILALGDIDDEECTIREELPVNYNYLILQLMAGIERLTKQLFHDSHKELWHEWQLLTSRKYDQKHAKHLYSKMCKAFDSLNSDYVGI